MPVIKYFDKELLDREYLAALHASPPRTTADLGPAVGFEYVAATQTLVFPFNDGKPDSKRSAPNGFDLLNFSSLGNSQALDFVSRRNFPYFPA